MPDRVIGILGGMGPEATVDFFREIIQLTPAKKDQEHIPILIYSDPRVPERTGAILHGGEDPTPYLVKAAVTLETAGAGILAMPCNTAHYYLPRLRPEVSIPILDMIEETYLSTRTRIGDAQAVGLLATKGTILSGVYRDVFGRHGMEVLVPDPGDQESIQQAIFQIKAGSYDRTRQETFERIGAALVARGAMAVILGCTEIPLGFNAGRVDYPVVNATRVLAQAAVDWALRRRE
ncbi:MAG: amino acid racemase [Acidobacteriia bacterium]|nr:amino acid racemase [Terriglobia bacterium]